LQHNRALESYRELKSNPKNLRLKFFLLLITVLFCSLCFSFHLSKSMNEERLLKYQVGYIWPGQNVEAEFSFPIYKDEESFEAERIKARNSTLRVFLMDKTLQTQLLSKIDTDFKSNGDSSKHHNQETNPAIEDSSTRVRTNALAEISQKVSKKTKSVLKTIIEDVYRRGFVNVPLDTFFKSEIVVRVNDNTEHIFKKSRLVDTILFMNLIQKAIIEHSLIEPEEIIIGYAKFFMQPNLILSPELTNNAEELAVKSVSPTEGIVRKGEIIVEKGQTITDKILLKLKSYQRSRFMKSEMGQTLSMFFGSFGHALIVMMILVIYLFFIRKRIFYDNMQFGIICAIIALASFFAWISLEISVKIPIEYFILLPGLSMLAAIVFDSRTAFYITVTMALMVSGIRGNDYDSGIALLFAGTLAAYTVRDIQSRTQMFKSIFFIFIGFLAPIIFLSLEGSAEFMPTVSKIIAALLNSALSPLFTFGLLFILERISGITTDLRFEEYDNLNHPLLQKLSEVAPGTYQHTLSVAAIAQRCAYAIGANALFVKVGSYFHDIGKIIKPEYFGENQGEIENKHDLISPRKSAEIIRNHVAEGIQLGREYKIPQRILDFIPMHHGTTLIKHFYSKALEHAGENEVNINDFRYPGPKPNTKEAAILMICDSAEALSRIAGMDKEELENALDKIVKDKILDKQFDECKLTFSEITTIQETCLKYLVASLHQRTKYKEIPENEQQKIKGKD